MAQKRTVYLGPRIKRLRRELGITQAEMAADLDISPSYVALIERNQRPTTADLLMRLAQVYRLDVATLADDDADDTQARIKTLLKDPLFAGIDVPALEVEDLTMSYPGISEALLRLYTAYEKEHLALADRAGAPEEGAAADPVAAVRAFLGERRNYFPALESAAERLAEETGGAAGFAAYLKRAHGLGLRRLPPDVLMGSVRRFDRHRDEVLIADTLDAAGRAFQTALQIVYLDAGAALDDTLAGAFVDKSARTLARRALAGYTAAAILMPYAEFRRQVERRQYDVEAIARWFGVSFEQAAHRLTTLQRPGEEGVSFFFIRVDVAGNVSKRLDGAGFPFARHGGACPLWNVHTVFQQPGRVATQWLELEGGKRFFSIARTVSAGGGGYGQPRAERAIALGCAAEAADRLIYTRQGRDAGMSPVPTPIGVTCRLCHRRDCAARSAPPLGSAILADDLRRTVTPVIIDD
ncbi:helix-turn-helix domain-containing protein [Pacificimonas flava]|uniref:Transcriptional regulator, XRE family n=1 Tax=Pacificimonas flava TaxID=1234595 RepID=M2TBI0_9SPHN|nr:XRE family transcriptional regulator [Pacificimonas flava]EMD83974.1 Transcriptional regulator, XRE family [Pacificimonas flava]MBB5281053.1 hypothetical protein [Pacificimonas flava]